MAAGDRVRSDGLHSTDRTSRSSGSRKGVARTLKPIPAIKICCIRSLEEAQLAAKYGAKYIGLVAWMPSGPGVITEEKIIEINDLAPRTVTPVLLTSEFDVDRIIKQVERTGVEAVQLVRQLPVFDRKKLRDELWDVEIFQVVHVLGEESIEEALKCAEFADKLLLDSGNPKSNILGGTGRTHNWAVSRKIVDQARIPVFLAGGLKAENIAKTIKHVQPAGVDVCSGIRRDNMLAEDLLYTYVGNVHDYYTEKEKKRRRRPKRWRWKKKSQPNKNKNA
ncbi:phosphoribosylanthranilate isomerase [bacterium]|nr:phosphoribosylanthranilate isomerase [bacterium]